MKNTCSPMRLAVPAVGRPVSYHLKTISTLALVGLWLALCGPGTARAADGAATPPPEKPLPAVSTPPAAEPRLTMLKMGAEPRRTLRLHPKVGDKCTATMTMNLEMEMALGGADSQKMKLPAMNLTMETTVKTVSPQGDCGYESVTTAVGVAEDSGATPEMADAMKTTLGGLKGVTVLGTLTHRGIMKGTELKATEDLNPQARQAMEQMKDAFANAGVLLPEEAVGVGAKWEVKQQIKSQGMLIDQTSVFELVSMAGDRITAKTTLTQAAENQQITNPAAPDMKIELIKLASTGTGEITTDLRMLTPARAEIKMNNESKMAMGGGDQKTEMSMKMGINIKLETK